MDDLRNQLDTLIWDTYALDIVALVSGFFVTVLCTYIITEYMLTARLLKNIDTPLREQVHFLRERSLLCIKISIIGLVAMIVVNFCVDYFLMDLFEMHFGYTVAFLLKHAINAVVSCTFAYRLHMWAIKNPRPGDQ